MQRSREVRGRAVAGGDGAEGRECVCESVQSGDVMWRVRAGGTGVGSG